MIASVLATCLSGIIYSDQNRGVSCTRIDTVDVGIRFNTTLNLNHIVVRGQYHDQSSRMNTKYI